MATKQTQGEAGAKSVRVDKWLWAARFFKSRSIAVTAIEGGKVTVNDERVKPSRDVKVGDAVRVRLGPYEHVVLVRALSDRRGPASQAALLYEETADSKTAREKLHWQLKHAAPVIDPGEGRPTKKDRRDLNKFKGY
jgi:ribosome-associated heat shock protein Hsp15